MRCRFLLFALALAVAAVPSGAQVPVASTATQSEAHRIACDELAAMVVPEAMVEPQVDRLVEAFLAQMFTQDAGFREMETKYPGMRDAVGASLKPALLRQAQRFIPLHRAELSQLYQDRLTTAEAREAGRVIGGPTFAAFVRSAYANMDYKSTAAALSKERDVSLNEVRRDLYAAGAKSGAALSPQDQAALVAFMQSPLGRKLSSIAPQKLAIDTKWMNYRDTEAERDVGAAVIEGMAGHIALTDPETAELIRTELSKPQQQ